MARLEFARRGVLLAVALCAAFALARPVAAQSSAEVGNTWQRLQRDAEVASHVEQALNRSLGKVGASVDKCMAELRKGGVNPEVAKILRSIAKKPGQQYFNVSTERVLARLERAAGRKLNLTAFDLETCVRAFDLYIDQRAHTEPVRIGSGTGCPPNTAFCQGTVAGAYICCSGDTPICAQSCDEDGTCEPYCEPSLSCFPGDATVRAEDGSIKRMAELRIGDRVEVVRADGSSGFEDVYLFTHKDGAVAARYVTLSLASGRTLSLSPRHFIPIATDGRATWEGHVLKGANEVKTGDVVWYREDDGSMASSPVATIAEGVKAGVFNPLTLGGTIVVDGVAASAHSDWFLDGVVSADTQGTVYQAMFAPVRGVYRTIGPAWMETIAEEWGIVDAAREGTSPGAGAIWVLVSVAALTALGGAMAWRLRRAIPR